MHFLYELTFQLSIQIPFPYLLDLTPSDKTVHAYLVLSYTLSLSTVYATFEVTVTSSNSECPDHTERNLLAFSTLGIVSLELTLFLYNTKWTKSTPVRAKV